MNDSSALLREQNVEQSQYLSRFFTKLLSEVLYLRADAVVFELLDEAIKISLAINGRELKSIKIKKSWFDEIGQWLSDRFIAFGSEASLNMYRPVWHDRRLEFLCAVRIAEGIVYLRVEKETLHSSKTTIRLTAFNLQSLGFGLAQLGVLDYLAPTLSDILAAGQGIIFVAAPDEGNLSRSIASVLALSLAHNLGKWASSAESGALVKLAQEGLLLAGFRADNVLDALFKLNDILPKVCWAQVRGILFQGFIKRTCGTCARQASADPALVGMLPDGLKLRLGGTYLVGRGCTKCSQSGYRGVIGVQSILRLDAELRKLLNRPLDEGVLAEYTYARGTRPLLEDGVRKVIAGQTTLECLYELVKVVPAAYTKFYQDKKIEASPAETPLVDVSPAGPEAFSVLSSAGGGGYKPSSEEEIPIIPVVPPRVRPLLLVVEDDPDQRTILEMVFKSADYDVCMAADGVAALAVIKAQVPDLIVLDLMMPRMDGEEFISRLKLDKRYSAIPILVLTVVADADKECNLFDLGADDYCEKTVQRKVLLKRVENLLKRRKVE